MIKSNKEGESKSSNVDVCEVNDMLNHIHMSSTEDNVVSVCANCGKEGANNICNKCKQVKYCNAACKKKHKKKHKKECEEYVNIAAEHAAKLHDEKIFKQPPPLNEDCPICFLMMPVLQTGRRYKTCCGKVICCGCIHAPLYDDQGNKVDNKKCPFCRIPTPYTNEETDKMEMKRMEADDPVAIYNNGCDYRDGTNGLPQDYTKALELYHRAAKFGSAEAYCSIGVAYNYGEGVEVDMKKTIHHFELAAMRGDVQARFNLGNIEGRAGNTDRAVKHYMIAVQSGHSNSLEEIKKMYAYGHASKEDYMKALQSYQEYLGDIKSDQRDKAAAADERYRYY